MTSRYLVTGGAGFIGSHLVHRLVRDGHGVTVLDDFSTGTRENLAPVFENIRVIEGSVEDASACRDAVRDVEFVLHHAALASVPVSLAEPSRAHAINTGGTVNLLEAARAAGVRRFINASTCAHYGNDPALPKTENMPPQPVSPYAASKAGAELFCGMFYRAYGLETISLRYFNVFGERQLAESAYAAVIPKFIVAALSQEKPVIFGDGEQTRDFVYVDDVVSANLLACAATRGIGESFNIGSGVRTSLNSLWAQIADITGTTVAPEFEPARPGEVRDSVCSAQKAATLLGYRPAVTLHAGLRRTVDAYRQQLASEPASA